MRLSSLRLRHAGLWRVGGVGVFAVEPAVALVDSLDTACSASGTHHGA
jgi:hypothetical protein